MISSSPVCAAKRFFIREEETATKFGLGRTVVRGIFSELAGKKLLKHVPYRGWELRPFTEEDLDAFSEMRELVETRALAQAHDRLDADVLQKILDGNDVPSDGRPSAHRRFVARLYRREEQQPLFSGFFRSAHPLFSRVFQLGKFRRNSCRRGEAASGHSGAAAGRPLARGAASAHSSSAVRSSDLTRRDRGIAFVQCRRNGRQNPLAVANSPGAVWLAT